MVRLKLQSRNLTSLKKLRQFLSIKTYKENGRRLSVAVSCNILREIKMPKLLLVPIMSTAIFCAGIAQAENVEIYLVDMLDNTQAGYCVDIAKGKEEQCSSHHDQPTRRSRSEAISESTKAARLDRKWHSDYRLLHACKSQSRYSIAQSSDEGTSQG